jgi:hypothetical protein
MDFGNGNVARRSRIVRRRVGPYVPASRDLFHQTVLSFLDSGFLTHMLMVAAKYHRDVGIGDGDGERR